MVIIHQLTDADLVVVNKLDLIEDMVLGLGATPLQSQQSGHADALFESIALPCTRPFDGAAFGK